MTTVTSGSTVNLFNGYGATVTITPGSGGRVSVGGRLSDGGAITPREIYSSTSISAPAGSTLSIEAIGADADYQTVLDDASKTALKNSGISRSLTKIAAAVQQARFSNPQVSPPISAAPTWATNTVYGCGQIVRGTAGASAQNNLYMLAGSTTTTNVEGTSAAAGNGPSGTGTTLITDNTCAWVYIGKVAATDTTTQFVSTASLTTSADEMNGYVQAVSTTTALAIGLTSYRPSTGGTFATEAYFTGGLFGARNAERVNGVNGGSVASPVYAAASERGSMAFCTNARKWIGLMCQASYFFKNVPYEILVNGRHLSETPLVFGVDQSAGSARVLLLNMSKFPEGKKTIEIRVYDSIQSRIAFEIYKEADDFVWPVENQNRFRMAFEGDSITQGSYISQLRPRYWIERIVGDHLGCDAVYNNAVGGTGMLANGGTKTTYLERLPDLVAFAPDIVVIGGIQNDTSYTSGQRQAAVTAYLTALRAALPNAMVFVVGIQPLQGQTLTAGSAQYNTELDVAAAVTAFNDPNVVFIPLLTDVRARVTSANGKHFLVGSAPYADTHPIPAYYPYIGSLIAEKISRAVLSVAG